jgi:Protein of unknown function (DUF1592)/Protein of unknown function (DUF1588)/Protein of unknown function (DUF1595)/Protein of unknown function (DUF1585)/Protein of unknown function (DUF1587)
MRQTLGALALLVLGCTANITGGDGQNPAGPGPSGLGNGSTNTSGGSANGPGTGGASATPQDCATTAAPKADISARIRRLTRLEVENTLADLLGDKTRTLARGIEPDTFAIGYSTGDERGVSSNYVDALKSVAEGASAELAAAPERQALDASCNADDKSASACAETFIKTFGARALRRPLSQSEIDGLVTVYQAGTAAVAAGDPGAALTAGLTYAVRALLQSSDFIFRTELGAPDATGASVTVTPYEAAAALSYALTASPPDADLAKQAASGALMTPEQLSAEGHRLLRAHPERFARQAEHFVREWLSIDVGSPAWNKDAKLYPEASPAFKAALDQETELFLQDWAQNPSFKDLLTSPKSFVSKDNAPVYGLTVTSSTFMPTMLDASQRAGVLTLPSYLGSRAHTDSSSPVLRGVAVLRKFLCLEPPPIPAMVPPLPPADKSGAKTTRERFAMHTSIAFCQACHQVFDPIGNTFEHYDAIGRYREQENGEAVDSSGALVGSQSSDAPVADAVALSSLLAAAPDVHSCFVRQTYRFTVGRKETDADACAVSSYTKLFDDKNLDLRELMLALVTDQSALSRAAMTPAP